MRAACRCCSTARSRPRICRSTCGSWTAISSCLSGHKIYGPTGIGVLYGKAELLERMPPYQGGGDMIKSVTFAKTTYADLPNKFEAGTPHIAGAIGLGAALDYVQSVGLENDRRPRRHAAALCHRADAANPRRSPHRHRSAQGGRVISFVVDDPPIASLDIGTKLDLEGIAVRTGHHCCQPVMDRFGIPGTTRISFAMYNTTAEIDRVRGRAARHRRRGVGQAQARPTVASDGDASRLIRVPPPPVPQAAADELAEEFEFFENWGDRYQYLLDWARRFRRCPTLRTEANRVRGCQSTVFLWARKRPGTADVIEFLADSDADLVRGLIALLERLFSGQKAGQVLAFDIEGFFARLGLDQHLTLGRRNGLAAMVQRIRDFAARLAAPERATK